MSKDTQQKAEALFLHMRAGGKVLVKDKHDFTIKESIIFAIYAEYEVELDDTVHRNYSVNDVTIIPLTK